MFLNPNRSMQVQQFVVSRHMYAGSGMPCIDSVIYIQWGFRSERV